MSLLITNASLLESAQTIVDDGYFKKLNTTTIKGVTSCNQKFNLLDFMVEQVIVTEEIPVSESDCNCMKEQFAFTQSCEDNE